MKTKQKQKVRIQYLLLTANTIYTIDDFKSQKFNSTKHFSIMHLNISSIEYHIEEFQIIVKLLKHQFDFICISETKLRDKLEPKTDINIEGYNPPIGMPTHASEVIYIPIRTLRTYIYKNRHKL